MAMGYAKLLLFAFCKYSGSGLNRRVMVERRGKVYAVGVCISKKA